MDPVKILKRAWHVLWNYRTLWIFGLIIAITASGSPGNSNSGGSRYSINVGNQQNQAPLPDDMKESFKQAGEEMSKLFNEGLDAVDISQGELTALIWIGVVFIIAMILLGVVMAFARYTSETAVIGMVNEYEATDTKMPFREGWRIGWSRTAWRLFLIDVIISLPAIILIAVLVVLGLVVYNLYAGTQTFAVVSTVGLIGIAFLAVFVVVLISIVLRLLRQFFWRVSALEEAGVRESFRRGYQMVRANWKDVGIMWLVMLGLGIAWMIVSVIAVIITIPIILITAVVGAVVAAIPGLLLVGFFSLFLSGYLPWVVGVVFVLPLFLVVAFSPWLLLSAWEKVYTSTVWTLVYRELKALTALAPLAETEPVGD